MHLDSKLHVNQREQKWSERRLLRIDEVALAVLLLTAVRLAIVLRSLAALALSLVVLIQHLLGNAVQQLLREDTQQLPRHVESVEDASLLVRTLVDVVPLEAVQELEGELVLVGQGFLTNDSFHGCGVTTDGILGVELVGDIGVVFPGATFTDCRLHETRETGEDVNRWVDALVV